MLRLTLCVFAAIAALLLGSGSTSATGQDSPQERLCAEDHPIDGTADFYRRCFQMADPRPIVFRQRIPRLLARPPNLRPDLADLAFWACTPGTKLEPKPMDTELRAAGCIERVIYGDSGISTPAGPLSLKRDPQTGEEKYVLPETDPKTGNHEYSIQLTAQSCQTMAFVFIAEWLNKNFLGGAGEFGNRYFIPKVSCRKGRFTEI